LHTHTTITDSLTVTCHSPHSHVAGARLAMLRAAGLILRLACCYCSETDLRVHHTRAHTHKHTHTHTTHTTHDTTTHNTTHTTPPTPTHTPQIHTHPHTHTHVHLFYL